MCSQPSAGSVGMTTFCAQEQSNATSPVSATIPSVLFNSVTRCPAFQFFVVRPALWHYVLRWTWSYRERGDIPSARELDNL